MAEHAETTSQADQAPDGQQATQAPVSAGVTSGPDAQATTKAAATTVTASRGNGAGAPEGLQVDLFLSYAEADGQWVEGYLSDALIRAGVRYTSEAAFALGVPRIQAFEQAVQQSRRTLLVLSSANPADGFSQFVDLLAQTYGLESATWPVIPLILQPVTLPPHLAMLTRLDATDPARWNEVVERLCAEAQRPAPAPAPPPACPYPGMVPFAEADSARFFGRETMREDLLQRLRLHPFLVVIGPSGSGKSSLVFAGLLPALRRSTLFGVGDWRVCTLRPGPSPLAALRMALGSDPAQPAQAVATALAADREARRLLLVVDQLEELFTLGAQEATPFAQALLALADTPGCFVLLTVRADFYPDLMTSPLWPRVQAHRAEVVPLSSDELRQAIVRPAEDAGVFVETALVERLLADAASEPGVLPLVQETLVLLWKHLERRYLPLRAYEALVLPRAVYGGNVAGATTGLQVAIARRADAALADLLPAQQAVARRIFLRLVQFGEGRADTRRQQPLDELRAAGDNVTAFSQTLSHLAACRLLTLSGGDGETAPMVDIAHEALITGWPALQEWIRARRAAELTRRRLEEEAQDWVRLGRGRGGLLDEVELVEAEAWLDSPDAQELGYDAALADLVKTSRAAIEQAARAQDAARQRELEQAQALAAEQRKRAEEQAQAAVLALQLWRTASEAEARAKRQAALATSRQLAAQAGSLLHGSALDLALLLAVEANRAAETAEAWIGLQQALVITPRIEAFLHGHTERVRSVAFSPDGTILASGCWDNTIRLWDVANPGQPRFLGQVTGHSDRVSSVAFSPDGTTLASGSFDRTIRLWDVADPRQPRFLGRLTGHSDRVCSVAFSRDGTTLASGSDDHTIRLWEVAHPRQPMALSQLTGHLDNVAGVAFSPDGTTLASGSWDHTIRLWEVANPRQPVPLDQLTGHSGAALSVTFSPDGTILASGSDDHTIGLWDVTHPRQPLPLGQLSGHTERVSSVAFSPDGTTLASGSDDHTIGLWDITNPRMPMRLDQLIGHAGAVWCVAFSPDGTTLASGSTDTSIALFDWQVPAPLAGHTERVSSVAFSPDGKTLASGSADKTVRLWDVTNPRQPSLLDQLTGHSERVGSVAFSRDGTTLASGSDDQTIRLWEVANPRQPLPLDQLTSYIGAALSMTFSPDGTILASGGGDGTVGLWDVATAEQIGQLTGHTSPVTSVAFSPDGKTLVSGSDDHTIRLWGVAHPRQPLPLSQLTSHTGAVKGVVFSPDGKTLASGGNDQTIRLWDVAHPRQPLPLGQLTGHTGAVMSLAFSPDGKTLTSGGKDRTVRLWDIATKGQIGQLTGHTGAVMSLAFSPNGKTLASGSSDQTIRLWNLSSVQGDLSTLEQRACSIANRNLTPQEWAQYIPDLPYPASQEDHINPDVPAT